ncbi:uncharacterized protein [Salvelinus sp. IW2-2015]|uniref:uncharacterized protein n=1 Tax=Salvelinus sp. IW2-2015 TaxID=2691554 RepID=UPI0038D50700
MLDVPALLLTSLKELTEEQLKTFQSHLTNGWMLGFPLIPESHLENSDRQDTVDQMVQRYGPERAVGITFCILREMKLDDLAENLQRDHTRVLLLISLEELTEDQLKTFQSKLNVGRMLGSPPIPESQLENSDRQDTVDQMVERYSPEEAVRKTLRILREINLDDLAENLERYYTRGNIARMYINLYITITVQCRSNQKEHSTDFIITFSRLLFYNVYSFYILHLSHLADALIQSDLQIGAFTL